MIEVFTDGATRPSNPGPSGYGVAAYRDGQLIGEEKGYLGDGVSNNQAEYCAFIAGCDLAERLAGFGEEVVFRLDSMLVLKQVGGEWNLHSDKLGGLHKAACLSLMNLRSSSKDFHRQVTLIHVDGHVGILGNEKADELAGQAVSTKAAPIAGVYETLRESMEHHLRVRGHEKLEGLIRKRVAEIGGTAFKYPTVEDPFIRKQIHKYGKVESGMLLDVPQLAVILPTGPMFFVYLSTTFTGRPPQRTISLRLMQAAERFGMTGSVVLVVHKPHSNDKWLTWGQFEGEVKAEHPADREVPAMCALVGKVRVTRILLEVQDKPAQAVIESDAWVPFAKMLGGADDHKTRR